MKQTTRSQPPTETKKPSGLVKALAFLLALALILAMPLAVLGFDIWRVVFNPPLVKAFITDEVVNSDLIAAGLEWFSNRRAGQRVETGEALSGVNEPDIVLLLSFMDADDWRAVKKELLTDGFLTHLVSVTVDGVYGWIDSAERVPQIAWELTPFKERVAGQPGENTITIAYDNLPPCTEEEIADFLARLAAAPPGVEVLYNLCEFPDPWHDDQFSDYLHALVDVNQNIPDQFALTGALSQVADQGGVGPEALKRQLRLIRLAGMLAWLLPLALLLLIAAISVRSLRTLGRWIGLPLIAGGLLAALLALALRAAITGVLGSGALSETPALLQQEVTRVVLRLAGVIFNPMLVQSAVVVALGVLMLVWYVLKGRQGAKAATTS